MRTFDSFVEFLETYAIDDLTPLERTVQEDILYNSDNPRYAEEILLHGCESGIVSRLVYSDDCKAFCTEHLEEVLEVLENLLLDGTNQYNMLTPSSVAWMAYEYVLKTLYSEYENLNW